MILKIAGAASVAVAIAMGYLHWKSQCQNLAGNRRGHVLQAVHTKKGQKANPKTAGPANMAMQGLETNYNACVF